MRGGVRGGVRVTAVYWWSWRVAIPVVRRERGSVVLWSWTVTIVAGTCSGGVVGRAGGGNIVRGGHVDWRWLRVGGGETAGTLSHHQENSLQHTHRYI